MDQEVRRLSKIRRWIIVLVVLQVVSLAIIISMAFENSRLRKEYEGALAGYSVQLQNYQSAIQNYNQQMDAYSAKYGTKE